MAKSNNNSPAARKPSKAPEGKSRPKCGIIMPISAIDNLSEAHWAEVNSILSDAIELEGFEANLVSSTEEVGIIQKTIIQNLYDNPVVVCDVSGKNPNVMFELGIRLAFDKPTIIVKDDKTSYSFDTSPIEHLNYPRDLRFTQIVDFKTKLAHKVRSTFEASQNDPNYTTFLKHFGQFKVARIDQTEVSGLEYVLDELKSVKESMTKLERSTRVPLPDRTLGPGITFDTKHLSAEDLREVTKHIVDAVPDSRVVRTFDGSRIHVVLPAEFRNDNLEVARNYLQGVEPRLLRTRQTDESTNE